MKRTVPALLIAIFLLGSTAMAARDDLPRYILDQLHDDITYTVVTQRNLGEIDRLPEVPQKKHFLVIQVPPENFDQDKADRVMGWVKSGGIMWFYDSRLANYFGMKEAPLRENDFQGKPHRDSYGAGKVDGINCIAHALPMLEHPLGTGVQTIQIFLMQVAPGQYSAVASDSPGVIPLFQVNLENKAVVALKKVGEGKVIFKPLVWLDVLGGERFQTNLMEYSGGYPVPKSGQAIIPAEALRAGSGGPAKLDRYDSLILSDGQQVVGKVLESDFEFVGDSGIEKLSVGRMDSIRLVTTGTTITFKDGSKSTGSILTLSVKFKTLAGKTVKVNKEDIINIKFDVGKDSLN